MMRIRERACRNLGRDSALRCPDAAARRPYHASKLALLLCILAVAVRLFSINQPYIDRWSWRQSDVAAIARNFSEHGFHFAYPQIDWAGGAPGYVGTEFPILPFLAAICYKIAGVHEWIGRSQAVIFFAVSLPFFFLLVREIFGGTAAIWATFFYSFAPLNVFAGRSFMPDVPSLSLALIGLYFFMRWIDDETPMLFLGAVIAISFALLMKLPSAVVGYGNRHPWYQLPLVPVAAAFAGAACPFIGSKISSSRVAMMTWSILLASSFAILAYLYVRPRYRSSAAQLRDAGLEFRKSTAPDSLIIAADNGDPTIFYYAERKGWHFLEQDAIYDGNPNDSRQAIVDLEQFRGRGATHVVFTASTFWWLKYYPEFAQHLAENATLMETTSEFRIYKLTAVTK